MSRRSTRFVAAGMALCLIVAACSKPKDETTAAVGEVTGETIDVGDPVTSGSTPGTEAGAGDGQAQNVEATGEDGGSTTSPTGPIAPPGIDESQARAVGSLIKPQSTQRRTPYYAGVGEDTIKLVFSIDATSCGVNVVNALTAAGGALPTQSRYYRSAPTTQDRVVAEHRESIDLMVKYWNEHAFDAADYAPEVRNLMGNDPEHQFYGRRLVHSVVDGGSNQCPEKTTAAAKQAVNEEQGFVVYNNYDGAQYNMAAALNAMPADRRPMHFGTLWLSDQIYNRFAPYAWTQFATGTTIVRQWASYVCSRVRTGQVPPRAPTVTDPKKRVFGLVHTNLPQDKLLANEFKQWLNHYCGGNIIAREVEYEGTDFGKAQQDNPNVIAQLRLAGVTTVLMLTDPVQPLFQYQAAKQQGWYPEWVWSSFGYGDSNTVQRLYDQEEAAGDYGVSQLGVYGGFGFGSGDPFAMYHTYHQVSPNTGQPCDPSSDEGMDHDPEYCKAPTWLVTWYYTMLPSIGALLFAGPDLTPHTASAGLQNYPTTRYGGSGPTSDPRPALVGAGKDKYGFIVDAVEWRWRPDFTSPPPEEKEHWVEYPDCMRHYITWPDHLAPMWERDGPNYSAWCGDENGYPRVLDSDKR